jgi:hypothetical protein
MDVFTVGLIVLFSMTAIFYIVVFSFFYYWHLKKISFIVMPAIFAFEFFAVGFLIVAIVSIAINYLPIVVNFFGL